MTTRREQREKRYLQILEVGLDQFVRKGYAAAKIADIAKAAGMSAGLLFNYFDSKAHLLIELVRLGVSAPERMVGSLSGLPPLEFFEQCAQRTLKFAAESEFAAKMFVLMGRLYYTEGIPEEAKALAMDQDFYRRFVPVVEAGQACGVIRQGDPLALCTAFWRALQSVIEAHAISPSLPLPEPEWIMDIIKAKKQRS